VKAFVVGFFSSVEDALRTEFDVLIETGTIVCVGKKSSAYPFDLKRFKGHLAQCIAVGGPDDPIIVIASDLRSEQRFNNDLKHLIDAQKVRSGREIRLEFHKDAQDAGAVIDSLETFGITGCADPCQESEISDAALTTYRHGKKILCVRGANQSEYEDVFRRANFKFARFDEHFLEMELAYSSNNGSTLKQSAKAHSCLIYAYGELKYLQPSVADKWINVHQGKNPSAAVARFKQAVQGLAQKNDPKEPDEK
jgi:hypothetical protein